MKYEYVGEDDYFCMELLAYKLVPMGSTLKKGDIVEIPDDNVRLIEGMKVVDHFQEVKDNKDNKKKEKK